ncbi:transposase family protein [Glycomyces sp. L485]|uniref:HARBI1 family protein n=1 Tax=Glycomyces sp. L485 TaxID=2909235 RepID=UPI001F4A775F|nr:transposase family protein [Glycomyces sp. L485]MCH7230230.1 transposase family protein [Glycomyces sp. L485]
MELPHNIVAPEGLRLSSSVTYRCVLPVDREVVTWFAAKLQTGRRRRRTRKGTRSLGAFRQAVMVLRWLFDGTRMTQLTCDNAVSSSTGYRYLHEGLDILAAQVPSLDEVIEAARAAGYEHVGLDGTLIPIDKAHVEGPTKGVDLWWSGKHAAHGGNLQVVSAPDGFPMWVSDVRPGREHDSTAAIAAGLDVWFAELNAEDEARRLLALVDLGYEKFADAEPVRLPHKKPRGKELAVYQRQYNKALGALRAMAEKANADLKMRFRALCRTGLNPWRIGVIARACLAVFQHEHARIA